MPKQKGRREDLFETYLRTGRKNVKKKKFNDAITNFAKAIELNPKCAEAYFERGMVFQLLKKRKNALEDYCKAIDLDPDFSHAYVHRARVYTELGKRDEAFEDIKKAYELDPAFYEFGYFYDGGMIHKHFGEHKQALEWFDKALKLKPPKHFQETIYDNIGLIHGDLEQYDKALEDFNQALELNPKSIVAYNNRGVAYFYLEQYDKALEDFENVIKLDANDFVAHLNKGRVYVYQRRFEKAHEAFRCAIELQPTNPQGYFESALAYEKRRQFDKALEQYDQTLTLDPKNAHTYTHIGIVHGNLCEFEEAIRSLSEAIELDPKEIVAYVNRGIGYTKIGNFDLALKDFEMAIELDPTLDLAYLGKGKVLCYLADPKMPFGKRKKYEQNVIDSFRKVTQITKDTETKKLAKWWIRFFKKYCDASAENKKRLKTFAEVYEDVLEANLFSTVLEEQNRLNQFMNMSKTFVKSETFFQILRRWNSFTPAVPGKSRSNLGGGYFLACDGQGTVIDPGYNFIENFMKNNYSLGDIDNIVLTHSHDDHTADFEAILSLLSKAKNNKRIRFFLNLGTSVKFAHIISRNESIIESVEILNENQTYQISPNLKMKATRAMHKDILTEASAKGLIFKFKRGSKKFRLGITGDTMLFANSDNEKSIYSLFKNVDVLVLHLGSIHRREFELVKDNFEAHAYDGEHLGIRGIVNLIFQCRPKLAIISEFGEELRDLRAKIAYNIDNIFENYDSTNNVRVIPGDIGLKIVFDNSVKGKCEICGALVKLRNIRFTETLIGYKIAYHCKHHKREKIVDVFKKEEEKELRIRAESMGCTLDLNYPESQTRPRLQ